MATLLAGALVFTGVTPAVAEEIIVPPVDETTQTSETTAEEEAAAKKAEEEAAAAKKAEEEAAAAKLAEEEAAAARKAEEEVELPLEEKLDLDGPSMMSTLLDDMIITPMALGAGAGLGPAPLANEVAIRINFKGGDRVSSGVVAPLAGAVFGAFQATGLNTGVAATATQTCTTDVNGQCHMIVPTRGTGQGSATQGYYVREITAPATPPLGYRIISSLAYSDDGLSVDGTTPYGFYTGQVGSGRTEGQRTFSFPNANSPAQNLGGFNMRTTSGVWPNARNNPTIPAQCGINVALLVDLSTSVNNATGGQAAVRNAATAVVDALTGTPSQIALHTFGTISPAPSSGVNVPAPGGFVGTWPTELVNDNLGLQNVASATSVSRLLVRQKALNLATSGGGTRYTNWDDGLFQLAGLAPNLDAVVMITDGMPTRYGNPASTDTATRFIEMENAIASANRIKALGPKIITVGVGAGAAGNASLNLQAISGPTQNSDWYQTDWEDLADDMRALADANCLGTVNVVKQVLPVGGAFPADALTQPGWTFSASVAGPAQTVRLDQPDAPFSTSVTGQTDATGALGLRSLFSGTTAEQRLLSITENPGAQYTLRPWTVAEGGHTAGDNARCVTNAAPTVALDITNIGNTGFTVAPQQDATISCTVVNQAVDTTATLRVDKIWRIDTNGDGVFEQVTAPNVPQSIIPGLAADLILSDNAGISTTPPWNFNHLYGNLVVNSTVGISENVRGLPVLCTNVAAYSPALVDGKTTLTLTSSQGPNVVTITNTVTCNTRLTLEKEVTGGGTPVTGWNLDAIAPGGALAGPNGVSGTAGATANVTPSAVYPLAESALNAAAQNYTQRWDPSLQSEWAANRAAGATGSWVCVQATAVEGGVPVWGDNRYDGRNGGVTVGLGGWSKCTAINDPKPTLQLVKKVSLNGVETVVPVGTGTWTLGADWSALTSDESGGNPGITPNPVTQSPDPVTGLAGFAPTRVAPGHYTLTETGSAPGYTDGTSYSCVVNGGQVPQIVAVGSSLTLKSSDTAVCEIVNTRQTGTLTITKALNNPQGVLAGKQYSGTYSCNDSNPTSAGTWAITGTGLATLTPTTGSLQIPTGTTCTVTETQPTGGLVDASWTWGAPVITQAGAIVAGQSVNAIVTNQVNRVYGSIAINKAVSGVPNGFAGTFSGNWSCDYPIGTADDTSGTWTRNSTSGAATLTGPFNLIPLTSVCTVTEGALPVFADPSYTWTTPVISAPATVTNPNPATVTFTVTNAAVRSSLQLLKIVSAANGGDPSLANQWELVATQGDNELEFTTGDPALPAAGNYVISERNGPAGYEWTDLTCTSNGSNVPGIGLDDGETTTVNVAAGANVICTLTNTAQRPNLTLLKIVDNANGVGSATPAQWTLTAVADGQTTVTGAGTASGDVMPGAEYTLSESTSVSGYTPGTWSCFVTGSDPRVAFPIDDDVVVPVVGTNVTCEITNTAIPATGTVSKVVKDGYPIQNPNGTWEIQYEVRVVNNSTTSTYFYGLTDALLFGAGITPSAASWTGPSGNGNFTLPAGTATLAPAGTSLAPSGTAIYTVTVTAAIANGVGNLPINSTCSTVTPTPANGGFLNSATLTVTGNPDTTVFACKPPAFPTITKVGTNPATQNADASWNVSYTVTITNPSVAPNAVALQVALTDNFPAAPSGWSLLSAVDGTADQWTVTAQGIAPSPVSGTYAPGVGTIWSGTIDPSTSYTYVVSGVLKPSTAAVPIGQCDPQSPTSGLINSATVTSGNVTAGADGCVTIQTPPVTVVKSNAGVVTQLSLTQWQIDYTVTVSNASNFATVYTLTDAPTPGAGWAVDGASNWFPVVTPGQPSVPAADTPIAGNSSHTYTYRMVVNRTEAPNPSLTCDLSNGGGFFNQATVTFPGGGPLTDTGCATPGSPTVAKDGKPAVQNADGTWQISYDVVVSNNSGKTLFYQLTDSPPAAPAGTTIANWAVTGPGGAIPGWPASSTIAQTSIANGASHTYTITATVTAVAGAAPVANPCGPSTGTGIGVVNTATVTNGVATESDDGCTSVNPLPVSVTKTVQSVTQTGPNAWSVVYNVAVTGPTAGVTQYTLTDTPVFADAQGVTFTGLSWTGQTSGSSPTAPATLQPGTSIASGITHTYVVTATANVTVPPLVTLSPCVDGQSGPFFNRATVTDPIGSRSDDDCAVPGSPTVTKTGVPSVQNVDGSYTIAFDIVVGNTSGQTLFYTLTDTPPVAPAGTTITGWAVAEDGTTIEGWPANSTIASRSLPTGETDTFRVTATLTLLPNATPVPNACGEGTATGVAVVNWASVTNGVATRDDDGCTSVNTLPVTVAKDFVSASQNDDASWTVDYTVTVTGPASGSTPYSLTDTPVFAAAEGVTFTGLTWTGQTSSDAVVTTLPATLQSGTSIASGETHTYNVTATATVNVPEGEELSDCVENQSGPFYNTATATWPGGSQTVSDCGEPASPTVVKTAADAIQNTETGVWTLSYDVVVSNTSDQTLWYSATDAPALLPTDVTGSGWTATGPVVSEDGGDGDLNEDWDGDLDTQLATGLIEPDATHTYTVSTTATVAASVPVDELNCGDEGGGIWNTATVTNGVAGDDDEACITIEPPDAEPTKTVTSTSQRADGTWDITYEVTVTNLSDEYAAVYDLEDALLFGGDIEILDASWTGPSALSPGTFSGPAWSDTLAVNEVLEPEEVDTYTVTAHASVPVSAFEGETLECVDSEIPGAGGFLNTVELTVNGETIPAADCSEPALPTVEKVGTGAAVQTADPDVWRVSYLVTVTPSGFDTFYSLQDTPAFPTGAVLSATGTAQRTDTDPEGEVLVIEPDVDFPGGPFAMGADDEPHTWVVTWDATIAGVIPPAERVCGEDPTPGQGFFNGVTLLQGITPVDEDETCIPVIERVYPTFVKNATSVQQDAGTGLWTITYDIDVDLAPNEEGHTARYHLTDTLDFGGDIEIESATWSGQSSGSFGEGEVTARFTPLLGTVIEPDTTHTYTVTVTANVTAEAIDDGTITCEEGQEGPEAGGFLNTALLTSGGVESPADACVEPVLPEVEKVPGSHTDNENGTQTIEYFITVTYPDVDQDPIAGVFYDLTDAPELPEGVELDGDWNVEADDEFTPEPDAATWNGEGVWTIITGAEFAPDAVGEGETVHTYRIWADVRVTSVTDEEILDCSESEAPGIPVWNAVELTSGEWIDDSRACLPVHWDDVGLVKTGMYFDEDAGEGGEWVPFSEGDSVEPGDTFRYVLTVTNYGTRDAEDVRVTDDDLNDRLDITALAVTGGVSWAVAPGWTENDDEQLNDVVDLTIASLAVGQSVDVIITVEFLPAATPEVTLVPPGGDVPEFADPLELLENEACVATDRDGDPDNNCDTEEIPTRDITGVVFTSCLSDAPLLGWVIKKSALLVGEETTAEWVALSADSETDPQSVPFEDTARGAIWSVVGDDMVQWPGTAFTPSGIAIDYPGWRPIQAGDIAGPNQYYFPGTSTVMTPEEQALLVYNGMIVDPSVIDFAWRLNTQITFQVNPTLVFEAQYPPATPECFQARHTEVQIEKTASVDKTEPGKSFTYTLEVENVSDDSAADGVVVTDAIPADIRITGISWPGQGDDTVFPNWDSCEVTGQAAGGYGGTLECILFGPLQPVGANAGASAAPTITLAAAVNPSSTASVITNVGVVDYHTFGDPEDAGRDSDDAVVLLSALPATGGSPMASLIMLGFLAMLAGVASVIVIRRRRGEVKPLL